MPDSAREASLRDGGVNGRNPSRFPDGADWLVPRDSRLDSPDRVLELFGGVKGRYVRLYSNGNTANRLNHYIEVEVWGKPAV